MVGSSGRQRVQVSAYDQFQMAAPPEEVLDAFGHQVRPSFALITTNAAESRTLTHTRDALLPKLISGEVRTGQQGLAPATTGD
jgi:type I restriction enzyme S subunit